MTALAELEIKNHKIEMPFQAGFESTQLQRLEKLSRSWKWLEKVAQADITRCDPLLCLPETYVKEYASMNVEM